MRGENVVGTAGFKGFVETESLFFDQKAHAFDRQERRVAFIHVPHGGLQAETMERPQAADSQHDFLADASHCVAAVQLGGDLAVLGVIVFGDVRIQQVQLHTPDIDAPDLDEDRAGGQA